jgi:hypothetical protein
MSFKEIMETFFGSLENAPLQATTWKAKALIEKLESMGDKNAIANYLMELGCTGDIGDSTSCPIANYLKRNLTATKSVDVGVASVSIANGEVETFDFPYHCITNGEVETFDLPYHCQQFITAFDECEFPELEREEDDFDEDDDFEDDEDDEDFEDDEDGEGTQLGGGEGNPEQWED